mgnify:CR=1 FL=1
MMSGHGTIDTAAIARTIGTAGEQNGAVYKIIPGLNAFAGYNENFALNGTGLINGRTGALPPKEGKQWETGIKGEFLNRRLQVNVSYFDIKQTNNTVPSYPLDPLNPNVLVPGVISRGFDGDWTWKATSKLYIMGSFANYTAKSVLGATFDGNQGSKFLQPGTKSIAYGSIPVNNTADRQKQMMFYLLWDFADGSLREGW